MQRLRRCGWHSEGVYERAEVIDEWIGNDMGYTCVVRKSLERVDYVYSNDFCLLLVVGMGNGCKIECLVL